MPSPLPTPGARDHPSDARGNSDVPAASADLPPTDDHPQAIAEPVPEPQPLAQPDGESEPGSKSLAGSFAYADRF
jgi:hypothetical protein